MRELRISWSSSLSSVSTSSRCESGFSASSFSTMEIILRHPGRFRGWHVQLLRALLFPGEQLSQYVGVLLGLPGAAAVALLGTGAVVAELAHPLFHPPRQGGVLLQRPHGRPESLLDHVGLLGEQGLWRVGMPGAAAEVDHGLDPPLAQRPSAGRAGEVGRGSFLLGIVAELDLLF